VTLHRARAIARAALPALALLLPLRAFAADVSVSPLELVTRGFMAPEGVVTLRTYCDLAVQIRGGYKFGGLLAVGLTTEDLESLVLGSSASQDAAGLGFLRAGIDVRGILSLPLTFSYFVGLGDTFCSGDGFADFGVGSVMTSYSGFLAFPTGPLYDGIYRVQGTGGQLSLTPLPQVLRVDLYAYEDLHGGYPWSDAAAFTSTGSYSADLRLLLNLPAVKLEAFGGGTWSPLIPDYFLRAGILFYASNRNVEFLTQIGIPRWDPGQDSSLNVGLFYLLVEPRLHLGVFSVVPTFFWHPAYYLQVATPDELGAFDVNLDLSAGDMDAQGIEGGVDGNLQFKSSLETFTVKASPWVRFSLAGILWNLKVNAKLWPFSLADILDVFVGVRAEF
jgi:hypothetical protein